MDPDDPQEASQATSRDQEKRPRVASIDSLTGLSKVVAIAVMAVIVGAGYLGWLALDQLFLRHTPLAAQLVLTACLLFTGANAIYVLYCKASGRTPRLSFGPSFFPTSKPGTAQLFLIGYSVVAFVSVTALLLRHHFLVSATGVSKNGSGLTYATLETYVWNIVDAVPTLNLTSTFGWHADLNFTNEWGRVLVLCFKLALIIPLFQVLTRLLERWVWRSTATGAEAEASGTPSGAANGAPVSPPPLV